MLINFSQILIIIIIFLLFGTLIAVVNLRTKKKKEPINKEQSAWQKIDELGVKKKELLEQKKELSYRFTAKSIDDLTYTKTLKYINDELLKIEEKINAEVVTLSELQKKENPDDELRLKNLKIKGNLNELSVENNTLKERIKELEEFIKNMKSQNPDLKQEDSLQIKYFKLIINKYKDLINENERKTISQLKEMIKPSDLTIKGIVSKFTPIGYDFNKDYVHTLRKVYNYLRNEITIVNTDLKIQFWMSFSRIITEKVCAEENIATLFCSIMRSLQDNMAIIDVVLLEDDKVHSFVTTKIKETYYIFDLVQNIPFDTYKDTDQNKLYEDYRLHGKKILRKIYSYNNLEYTDYVMD